MLLTCIYICSMSKKVILIILDGWGIATNTTVSAVDAARTPFIDGLYGQYPHSKLEASGLAVGLPEGQMGNSEVGHMNLGAGRVVYQDLVRIHNAVQDGTLAQMPVLKEALQMAKAQGKKVHFMGLVSDGGVHAHIDHLKGLLSIAASHNLQDVYVHAFTDGRDTDPKGGLPYLQDLQQHMAQSTGQLASITGRYYAMDRDKRWERIKLAYDALVHGQGTHTAQPLEALQQSYDQNVTDEFVRPIITTNAQGQPLATIAPGDVVINFNFRTDRGRQISMALTQQDFLEQQMQKLNLHYLTMARYDDTFENVSVLFEKDNLQDTLGETLARQGKKQVRIAETEKYPHVTFFFNGGRETPFEGEERILCPSPKVATYDLQPEMSAADITNAIVPVLEKQATDFVCLNFANPDMVGHTGVFEAAVKACETVDGYAEQVVNAALKGGYTAIIIADHGNADIMRNADGSPHTAHTTNLVPCIVVSNDYKGPIQNGKLGDIAPTILTLMGLEVPAAMSGQVLVQA